MTWARHIFGSLFGLTAMVQTVVSQPIRTLTMILSICNIPPAIDRPTLTKVLLRSPSKNTTNLQEMIGVCSQGKASFSTRIVQYPIYIPCKSGSYWAPTCNVFEWADFADRFAKDSLRIPIQSFDSLIYVLPQGNLCGFGGLGYMGPCGKGMPCRVWISGQIADQVPAYFHELGHNLGLAHASYMDDQYGDQTDAMGYCCSYRCFAAPHTDLLKWSKPKYRAKIPLQRNVDYVLGPNEYIVVQDQTRAESTYIQFRKGHNGTYDKDVTTTAVNIYTRPHIKYSMSNLESMLWMKEQMWQSMYAIKVTLINISMQRAIVRVEPTILTPLFVSMERVPL